MQEWCTAAARLRRRGEVNCFRFHSLALCCAVPHAVQKVPAQCRRRCCLPPEQNKSNSCGGGIGLWLTAILQPSNTNNKSNFVKSQQPHSSNKTSRSPSLS